MTMPPSAAQVRDRLDALLWARPAHAAVVFNVLVGSAAGLRLEVMVRGRRSGLFTVRALDMVNMVVNAYRNDPDWSDA